MALVVTYQRNSVGNRQRRNRVHTAGAALLNRVTPTATERADPRLRRCSLHHS